RRSATRARRPALRRPRATTRTCHGGRRSGGRQLHPGQPAADHRRLDGRPSGQGRGGRAYASMSGAPRRGRWRLLWRKGRPGAVECREIAVEQSFIFAGAVPAIVIYAFASAGVVSSADADNITLWTGIALLGGLGLLAGLLERESLVRCLGRGAESAVVGALIV